MNREIAGGLMGKRESLSLWLSSLVSALPRPWTRLRRHDTEAKQEEQIDNLAVLKSNEAMMRACNLLWANVKLRNGSEQPSTVLLASARADAEVAALVSALGQSVAYAQRGDVLVIDGDLRESYLHLVCNVPASPGLAEVLDGTATLGEAVRLIAPRLFLLPAGDSDENPTLLFETERLAALKDELTQRFETVLIVAPGLLTYPDAHLLAAAFKNTVLLVDARTNTEQELRHCKSMLELSGATILGSALVVAN